MANKGSKRKKNFTTKGVNMSINHDNNDELNEARLTAYALGQLNDDERAAVEEFLKSQGPEAAQFIRETAALGQLLQQANAQAHAPSPSVSLRAAIDQEIEASKPTVATAVAAQGQKRRWASAPAFVASAVVSCVIVSSIVLIANYSVSTPVQIARQCSHMAARSCPQATVGGNIRPCGQPLSSLDGAEYSRSMVYANRPSSGTMGGTGLSSESQKAGYSGRGAGKSDSVAGEPFGNSGAMKKNESASMVARNSIDAFSRPKLDGAREWSRLTKVRGRFVATVDGDSNNTAKEAELAEEPGDTDAENEVPAQQFAPGTEQYDRIVDNRFCAVEKQPLSTFSIDVDTASYANMRRFLNEGRLPPADAVRIEELVNYFRYDYAPPRDSTPFAVHIETAACPWREEHRLVRIGLKGREIDRKNRGPSNLVFLLDVSGSMGMPDKLPLVKQAMRLLVEQLGEDDRVAIVTYASGTDVRLPSARGQQRARILATIDALEAGGCTYGSAGLDLAYQQAAEHFIQNGVNRVILCTDGDLNVGITNDDDLSRLIQKKAKSGVFLTVLGFGTGNLKDSKMEKLADKGNGVYAYIDGLREARRVLVEQLSGSLVTIAKDVKIQVEFNPAEVAEYRLLGYENRVMANRDFSNDKKDAGDIGAGHTVTALYEITPAQNGRNVDEDGQTLKYHHPKKATVAATESNGELLTVRLRYREPTGSKSRLLEFPARDSDASFAQASADFRFAASVAAFGLVLRHSPHRGNATLPAVEKQAATALGSDPNGYRAEFIDLVRKARSLAPQQ